MPLNFWTSANKFLTYEETVLKNAHKLSIFDEISQYFWIEFERNIHVSRCIGAAVASLYISVHSNDKLNACVSGAI